MSMCGAIEKFSRKKKFILSEDSYGKLQGWRQHCSGSSQENKQKCQKNEKERRKLAKKNKHSLDY